MAIKPEVFFEFAVSAVSERFITVLHIDGMDHVMFATMLAEGAE